MKMADIEDFCVSHFGWCNLKSFQEDWTIKLNLNAINTSIPENAICKMLAILFRPRCTEYKSII